MAASVPCEIMISTAFAAFAICFIHKFPVFCGKSAKYMICQIPSLRLCTNSYFNTEKFLCAKLADNIFDPVMSTRTSLLADAKLPGLQINIIINTISSDSGSILK